MSPPSELTFELADAEGQRIAEAMLRRLREQRISGRAAKVQAWEQGWCDRGCLQMAAAAPWPRCLEVLLEMQRRGIVEPSVPDGSVAYFWRSVEAEP